MSSNRRKLRGVDQPLFRVRDCAGEREMAWNHGCMNSLGEEHEGAAEVPLPRLVEIRDVLLPGIDEKDAALCGLQQGRHSSPRAVWVGPPWEIIILLRPIVRLHLLRTVLSVVAVLRFFSCRPNRHADHSRRRI
jgi:hypothetical protein